MRVGASRRSRARVPGTDGQAAERRPRPNRRRGPYEQSPSNSTRHRPAAAARRRTRISWPISRQARIPTGRPKSSRRAYFEAIAHPQVVGLRIATRPDCLDDEVSGHPRRSFPRKPGLVVEIGLQTIHDRTLAWLRRGHDYAAFLDAYRRCRARRLNLGVHVILGLPGESRDDMLATARALACAASCTRSSRITSTPSATRLWPTRLPRAACDSWISTSTSIAWSTSWKNCRANS